MPYRIVGLEPAPFARLWSASAQALAEAGAQRVAVTEKPGAPCRVSLDDAEIGEEILLLSYLHQPNATPYRQQGPIFIRNTVEKFDAVGLIPPAFARRTLSIRAFDAHHQMIDADLSEGVHAEALIERMLANPEAAYLHAHYARRGCFAGEIRRL